MSGENNGSTPAANSLTLSVFTGYIVNGVLVVGANGLLCAAIVAYKPNRKKELLILACLAFADMIYGERRL